jgi:hypothetical protein
MPYTPKDLISTKNSTTTAINAGVTFTGVAENVSNYATVSCLLASNVGGTLNLQFSPDGTNWDHTEAVANSSNLSKTAVVVGKFFRIQYVNGGSNQTYFRMQTMFHVSKGVSSVSVTTTNELVSSSNSTITPLNAAASFTGVAEDISSYSTLTCLVTSDVAGTLNMQISPDGTNWDRVKSVNNFGNTTHTLVIVGRYFRINYVNGSSNQSYFRLQTIYHVSKSKMLTSTARQIINDENDVELTRTVNYPQLDMARNIYSDKFTVNVFGRNTNVGTGLQDLWAVGGFYPWLENAEPIRIKAGGSADDTAGGIGTRTITVQGLDANYNLVEEDLVTAGALASAQTTNSFIRLHRAFIKTTGDRFTSGKGNIEIESVTSSSLLARMILGTGRTQLGFYTVPAGYQAYIRSLEVNIDAATNKTATIRLRHVPSNTATSAPYNPIIDLFVFDDISSGVHTIEFKSYLKIDEKSDILSDAVASATGTKIEVFYEIFLVKKVV